uniref:Uncharacterized protein n=1 Tax=Panagrolaimus sp. PS1159 TaxID=55785 RepID=A0AC35GHY7_9BILA
MFTPLSICSYLITHRCYKMFIEKAKFEYNGNDDDGPPEAEGPPKWCFKYSVKNGTLIICGIFFVCCITFEVLVLIKDNFEIDFNSIFPMICIIFAVISAFIGTWKEKSWLMLPFVWVLETFVFISFTIFINSIFSIIKNEKFKINYENFMFSNNIFPFKYWIKLMFFENVLHGYVENILVLKTLCFIICILAVALTTWLFLIVHSCYMLINQKQREQKLEHQRVSIEEC